MRIRLQRLAAGGLAWLLLAPVLCLAGTLEDLRGTWQLERAQSESMRPILSAQGYSSIEVGILDRLPVRQTYLPDVPSGGLTIQTRTSVVGTSEILTFDDVFRPAESPLGRIERAAAWEASSRTLCIRLRYKARNGQPAEMSVTRRFEEGGRSMVQETRLRLAGGPEMRASQKFVRQAN